MGVDIIIKIVKKNTVGSILVIRTLMLVSIHALVWSVVQLQLAVCAKTLITYISFYSMTSKLPVGSLICLTVIHKINLLILSIFHQ